MNSCNLRCLRKYFIFIFEDLFYSVVNSRLIVFSFSRVVAPISWLALFLMKNLSFLSLFSLFPPHSSSVEWAFTKFLRWNRLMLRWGEILSPMSFRGYSKHTIFSPSVLKTLSLLLSNVRCAFVLFPHIFCTWNSLTSWICGIIVFIKLETFQPLFPPIYFFLLLPALRCFFF